MTVLSSILLLLGSFVAVLSGAGLLKFSTSYARFHSAGKASPIAFLLVAAGAGIELGLGASARLAVAGAALILTLPVGVHLLFRAVHRTTASNHLTVDDLAPAERRAANGDQ